MAQKREYTEDGLPVFDWRLDLEWDMSCIDEVNRQKAESLIASCKDDGNVYLSEVRNKLKQIGILSQWMRFGVFGFAVIRLKTKYNGTEH